MLLYIAKPSHVLMLVRCLVPTIPYLDMTRQEQLTAVRGYAVQEVNEVEESTLQKLEDLKQEYEVEVEQLGTDLAVRTISLYSYVFAVFSFGLGGGRLGGEHYWLVVFCFVFFWGGGGGT